MTLKIGSLCTGIGGLDLAAEETLNAETIWYYEYHNPTAKILAQRWPHLQNHGDITNTKWHHREPIDILTAGYPCQPFSKAGQRKGVEDERHLWPHINTAIRILRPQYVLLENVPGHRSLGLDTVLGDLAQSGYDAEWTTLRASDVRAPHHRERLFIVATDANPHSH